VGEKATPNILAEEIADEATEIVMPRVRQEAPRIGDHADETREQAHVRQGSNLRRHAVELIEEPPPRAVLHLAGHRAVLEVADHRGEQVIVAGVEVVEDRLLDLAGLLEAIEKSGQWPSHFKIADGVESGIPADRSQLACVVVAHGAEVKLLDPAAGVVHDGETMQQRGFISAGGALRYPLSIPHTGRHPPTVLGPPLVPI